jgi:hypothetical protein
MPADVVVNLDIKRVRDMVHGAADEVMSLLCERVAYYARRDIARDTGFAAETIFVLHPGSSGMSAREQTRTDSKGNQVKRRSAEIPAPGPQESIVGVAAEHAFYIERRKPFFMPAIDSAMADLPQFALDAGRKYGF